MSEYLSPEQVSERVPGLTPRYLQELRSAPMPRDERLPFIKLNARHVVYEWADVQAWLAKRKQSRADRFGVR